MDEQLLERLEANLPIDDQAVVNGQYHHGADGDQGPCENSAARERFKAPRPYR
jgi:hypothetical protein